MKKALRTESLAIHAGRRVDPGTGAVLVPVYLNTTFERAADGSYPTGYEYIRDGHPNTVALETTLASLEQGSDAVVFSSGSAAIMAVLFSCGQRHIVAGYDCYNGTLRQLREIAPQWGAQV
ncbi:MAG: cystathionine gamma-synthase, partial [Gammaproteobacteria bacterium]|nr:cystathionine gamma-synthase [Gammaproteobacteria bacterium]